MGLNDSYCNLRVAGRNNGGQRTFDNKRSGLVCRYCKKPGHTIDKCYKIHGYPANFKFTKQRSFQNTVQENIVQTNEEQGDQFTYNVDSNEKSKPLTKEQLDQVMLMLHPVKPDNYGTNPLATASGNYAGPFNDDPQGPW